MVLERSFAWPGRSRTVAKDFERLIDTTAMACLAIIRLLIRRLASL